MSDEPLERVLPALPEGWTYPPVMQGFVDEWEGWEVGPWQVSFSAAGDDNLAELAQRFPGRRYAPIARSLQDDTTACFDLDRAPVVIAVELGPDLPAPDVVAEWPTFRDWLHSAVDDLLGIAVGDGINDVGYHAWMRDEEILDLDEQGYLREPASPKRSLRDRLRRPGAADGPSS